MGRVRSLGITLLLLLLLLVSGAMPAAAEGGGYVVRPGDTLFSIAMRHGTTVEALMAANGLASPLIYAGQTLRISGAGTAAPAAAGATHVVQRGETLFSLARRYGTTVEALMAANGLSSSAIYAGQVLRLPGGAMAAAAAPIPGAAGGGYVVVPGDTLFSIARRHGTTVDAMKQLNNLGSDTVYVGQRLMIPGTGGAPAAAVTAGSYIVRAGDTLTQIAAAHNISVGALAQANGLQPGSWVYAGQRLVIPGGAQVVAAAPAAPAQGAAHVVRPGETLFSIARQYGTTVDALVSANRLVNASQIYAGQRLVIPGRSAAAAAPPPASSQPQAPAPPPAQPAPAAPATATPEPSGPASPPIVGRVWTAQVTDSGCTDEETGDFRGVVRVNVEGRTGQQVDLYAQPVQDSTLVASMKSGSKIELGPYGTEFAPLGGGKYSVVAPGLGRADFFLDGRCTVYVNFSQVSR